MSATSLFVSHISEEAKVAALLREMLEEDFLHMVTFFTSSDIGSIGAGQEWLGAIGRAMDEARLVLVLCSRASVHRPWVQFEVGAAWMKGVPIVPVCHSGLRVADLQMPLSLRQGVELGTQAGLERLYAAVAKELGLPRTPPLRDAAAKLERIAAVEQRFRNARLQQFERFFDVVIPPPGRLAGEQIPDDARVESNAESLALFGLFEGSHWTWRDIVRAARRTPDTRWLAQLQKSIYLASNDMRFRPVQAIFHGEGGSYQPQLSKKEVGSDGESRFHVHLVDTVVQPLSEVENSFGLLATLLRLGLRFRYEVIAKFRKPAAGAAAAAPVDERVRRLREAVETIENDALSRGAQNIDRDSVIELFEGEADQQTMLQVQQQWDEARALLFRDEPPHDRQTLAQVLRQMRDLNYAFMTLGTRRFHEMVRDDWAPDEQPGALARAA